MSVLETLRRTSEIAIHEFEEKLKQNDRAKQLQTSLDLLITKCIQAGHISVQGDCEIIDNTSLSKAISASLSNHVFETPVNTTGLSNNLCLSIFNRACGMTWIHNGQSQIEELEQSIDIFSSFLDIQIDSVSQPKSQK